MAKYTLSYEGRARFGRMRIDPDIEISSVESYEILNYLYENGPSTVEVIVNSTGLSWDHVAAKISSLMNYGYVEALVER